MADNIPLVIDEVVNIGRNDEWLFQAGRCGGRWLGLATARVFDPDTGRYMHVFPQVSEGFHLGLPDRDKAVRLTGALAQDAEGGFGGVAEWFVPPELRGTPDEFRCKACGTVGCPGDHEYDPEDFADG